MTRDLAIERILTCLHAYGDTYTGNHPRETAGEWYDAGFPTPDEVSDWCDIGVWDPWTAAVLAKELTPDEVSEAAENVDGYHDPIYACCNGDLSPKKLVKAWRAMQ